MFDERRIRKHGTTATAEVVSITEHGKTSRQYREQTYDYVLEVRPLGAPSFRATVRHRCFVIAARPKLYDVINVKYDERSQQTIFVFDGDARYDITAMNARSAELNRQTAEMKHLVDQYQAGKITAQQFEHDRAALIELGRTT